MVTGYLIFWLHGNLWWNQKRQNQKSILQPSRHLLMTSSLTKLFEIIFDSVSSCCFQVERENSKDATPHHLLNHLQDIKKLTSVPHPFTVGTGTGTYPTHSSVQH
jgi:hypothetical protein